MILSSFIAAALFFAAMEPAGVQTELVIRDDRPCTADGAWCVDVVETDNGVRPVLTPADAAPPEPLPEDIFAQENHRPWSGLIHLPDGGFLIGVENEIRAMYSGGGGMAAHLQLYRANARGETAGGPVLTVPMEGNLMIRACFSEADMDQRAGACHDEYAYEARLQAVAPDDVQDGALPALDYEAVATSFPRGVSRFRDSLQAPPLTSADHVAERDPDCSFRRRFVFDPETNAYRPDRPLPDCSAYTVP